MAFEDDIKGQNTQLYPVVVIDGAYYSTNNVTINGNYCKPILMNIPSIKESIDIESRKFKISNVTLDFNNFPFEGVRFSDQLSDTSLINKEAIIYYKSPSTNTIDQMYELFRGIIRRISHDDTKATVELEDLTEKELHKDLPSEILPDTEGILEKYRNKPKPMVYGSVDKSPVVLGSNNKIIIDYKDIDGLDDTKTDFAGDSISPFKIELDGKYMGVLPVVDTDLGTVELNEDEELQAGLQQQWELFENEIVLTPSPLISRGILQCKGAFKPRTIELESIGQNQQNFSDDEVAQLTDGIYTNQSLVDIDSTREISTEGNADNKLRMFRLKIFTDIGVNDAIKGSDNFGSRVRKIALNGYFLPIPKQEINHYQLMKIFPVVSGLPDSFKEFSFHSIFSELSGDTYDLTGLFRFGIDDYSIYDSNYVIPEDYDIEMQPFINLSGDITEFTYMPCIYMYDICGAGNERNNGSYLIDFRIHGNWGGGFEDSIDATYNLGLQGYFKEIDFNAIADIDTVFTKQFYVDVKGRFNTLEHPYLDSEDLIENPIDIIYDLVRTELGHDAIDEADYLEARTEHSDWKFAFTLNKKMNSKKLIEDIAKSTKCFPKFKNDGTFGFNTIKEYYSIQDYKDAKEIVYSDIISYTYKKTKPEQIYRKVDVQYNMDYAQDSLLSRSADLDFGGSEFYGIESSDDAYLEFESPYIRDKQTAENLTYFLASQYKDDHLMFNLKLPLQYINLEIGDIIKFRELGLKAYGIDYRLIQLAGDSNRYPLFMITSITKNLDSVQIECMQLHFISTNYYDGFFETEWYTQIFQEGQLFYFPDIDPLTITPFIPEPEGEVLGEELITNNDFTNGLSNWTIGYPNGSAFDNSENISVSNNQVTMTGTTSLDYIAKVNLINAGDTRLYRLTIDIESFVGEKWDVSANGVTYGDGVGASIRSQHQDQPTGVFTTEFVWNNVTHGQVPGNFEQNYGIRINSIGTMVLNSISLREVIQEAPPFDGGLIVDDDNAWTLPTGASQGEAYVEDNVLIYNNAYVSGAASLKYLHTEELNSNKTYRVRFEIFDWVEGSFKISLRNQLTPAATGNDIYEFYINPSVGGLNYSYTYTGGNPAYYPNIRGTFKVKNLSIHEVEDNASVLVSRNRFKVDELLQEQELYAEDNKYDLKDLKDME